ILAPARVVRGLAAWSTLQPGAHVLLPQLGLGKKASLSPCLTNAIDKLAVRFLRTLTFSTSNPASIHLAWDADGFGRHLFIRPCSNIRDDLVRLGCIVGIGAFTHRPQSVNSPGNGSPPPRRLPDPHTRTRRSIGCWRVV